jgi:hypothetical protein
LRELQDLSIAAWLLSPELITGKRQDIEALILMVFVKGTQTCVLRGKSSAAGNVNDQAQVVLKLRQLNRFTGDAVHFDFMKRRHL